MDKRPSCIKKTLEYLFVLEKGKRFVLLFLLMLPLGFLLAVAVPNSAFFEYISSYTTGNPSFWNSWNLNDTVVYKWSLIAAACAFVYYVFIGAVCFTVISRSLRTGTFAVKRPFAECNESFFPALYSGLLYLFVVLFLKTINTACLVMFQRNPNAGASLGASLIAIIAMYALVSYVMTLGTLYTPFMVFNGVNPLRAFVLSAGRVSGKKFLRAYPQVFLPVVISVLAGAFTGFAESSLISLIAESVIYTLLAVYLTAYPFISYYTLNDLKREDYTREYYYKHGRE